MGSPNFLNDSFFTTAEFCWLTQEKHNCILPVRNQFMTNCCYAFTIVDSSYSAQYLKDGFAIKGSEQELLDCLHHIYPPKDEFGNNIAVGVKGVPNSFENGFQYLKTRGGCSEEGWPFQGKCTTVKLESGDKYVRVKNLDLEKAQQTGIRMFTTTYGRISIRDGYDDVDEELRRHPVAACIYSTPSFKEWKPEMGVYEGPTEAEMNLLNEARREGHCRPFPHHSLTLVGYGVDGVDVHGTSYYVAKNSYGHEWGYKGYIKIAKVACKNIYYTEGYTLVDMDKKSSKRVV